MLSSSHLFWFIILRKYLGTQHKRISLKKRAAAPLPACFLAKCFLFLLKTPPFSLDTAPRDEQGVQERDPRPENLLSPTFQLQAFFGGEKTPLNLGELGKFSPSLGIQKKRFPGEHYPGWNPRRLHRFGVEVSGISTTIQSVAFPVLWEHSQGLGGSAET